MAKSVYGRLGCLTFLLLIAVPAAYLFGLGWVRTIAPVAPPLASGNLLLELEAADFRQSIGLWPILSNVTYPNAGPIRGQIRNRAGGANRTDYEITISSRRGMQSKVRCFPDFHDACYFHADLGQTDLTEGILISVAARDGQPLMPPRLVIFERTSRYSFALWDMFLSV